MNDLVLEALYYGISERELVVLFMTLRVTSKAYLLIWRYLKEQSQHTRQKSKQKSGLHQGRRLLQQH